MSQQHDFAFLAQVVCHGIINRAGARNLHNNIYAAALGAVLLHDLTDVLLHRVDSHSAQISCKLCLVVINIYRNDSSCTTGQRQLDGHLANGAAAINHNHITGVDICFL